MAAISVTVAEAIQKVMGDGWTVRRLTDDGQACWWGEVNRSDGTGISISHDDYRKQLTISVNSDRKGYYDNELKPDSIKVSSTRNPDSIAKDFVRKMLPMAEIFWQDERDRIASEKAFEARLDVVYARLATAGKARPYTRDENNKRPDLSGDRWRTKHSPGDKNVTIELDLDINTAVKLLEWFEQNKPVKKEY